MLSQIATEPRRLDAQMERAIFERWLLDLTSRVKALEDARGFHDLQDRVSRLEAIVAHRQHGWWERDPRIEAFVRKSVVALRQQGFEERHLTVILGVSPADLRKIAADAGAAA
jgi:hypothetical protein